MIQRHNEIRDAIGDIASIVCKEVIWEPVVQKANDACGVQSLIADLSSRGVWQPQTVALFDLRVVDTDAPSYSHKAVAAILSTAIEEKRKYCDASFTPLVVSVDGVLGREAECFVKLLAEKNATIRKRSYPEVAGWIRSRLPFAILRAKNLGLRGSQRSGAAMDDGLVCQNLRIKWLRYALLFYFFTFSMYIISCRTSFYVLYVV